MNPIQKTLGLVLLACLVCSFLPLGASTSSLWQRAIPGAAAAAGLSAERAAPASVQHVVPLSLLVYTQYVDSMPGQELENTLAAINATYGTDYYVTALTNYANLATALPGHQILLIPEQEQADSTTMNTVGTAWASTLTQFVAAGGIVILMDYIGGDLAPTIHIYNASGLMQVYGPIANYPSLSVNLVNSSDALARGVASSWTSPDGTLTFGPSAADGTVVVASGINPVVTHKILGKGHVVLLGYDLFNRETNADQLLGNAIRLHRHVVFDASHGQSYTIFDEFSSYADDLTAAGFAVSSMGAFSVSLISACDVLVISACSSLYSPSEKSALELFVANGGGIYLLSDWGGWGNEVDDVANVFGYDLDTSPTGVVADTDDNIGDQRQPYYDGANLHNHSLTLAVNRVQFFYGTAIVALPAQAVRIVTTDMDATAQWGNGTAAQGLCVYAAALYGLGRIVLSADTDFLSDSLDYDSDGTGDYFDYDNEVFALNTIRWLSAAGLKERNVLFDQSHSPWHTIGGSWLDCANYLTCNGYTLHWMSTFHTELLDSAHVLVLCEGTVAYTAEQISAITTFVNAGGGLVLLGDWGSFNQYTHPIGSQFGLNMANGTGTYLSDSDDGSLAGNSYIVYERAEGNIGTHPITQGVNRIEVDRSGGFNAIGTGVALVATDTDGTCTWANTTVANGVAVFAAVTSNLGHVAYLSDVEFFSTSDPDADGETTFFDSDNNLFIINLFEWVSEPEVPVTTLTIPWWFLPLLIVILVIIVVVVVVLLLRRQRGAKK